MLIHINYYTGYLCPLVSENECVISSHVQAWNSGMSHSTLSMFILFFQTIHLYLLDSAWMHSFILNPKSLYLTYTIQLWLQNKVGHISVKTELLCWAFWPSSFLSQLWNPEVSRTSRKQIKIVICHLCV